ncbi:hypothetical protein PHSY_000609 [Pseudozyma hubeiensis SY62]|uniref:Uncharacterized protein n=1 Tax=Pseudozyma hubeiensis (strain SY62) TaxID=1305764 RepID=R9NWQ0_PSEHS|nr:hypothetical protein PHSY_000609 [Pseudozyma hubeiensis SY62]GAC93048.1 hypothetical protein PHSY_000609 [Pseudozyma hubeiensis SY62]
MNHTDSQMVSLIRSLICTAAFSLGLAFAAPMEHGDGNRDWSHYFQGGLSDAMFDWPAESSTSDMGDFWTSDAPASSFVSPHQESFDRAPALPLPMDQSKADPYHSRGHTPADVGPIETTADNPSPQEQATTTMAPESDDSRSMEIKRPLPMPETEGSRFKKRERDELRAFKTRTETLRSKVDSPMPAVFSELKRFRPLIQDGIGGKIVFKEHEDVHAHINSFFANKVNWVGLDKIPIMLPSNWRARSPIKHTSFRLPPAITAAIRGERLEVYVTEHNLVRTSKFQNLKNSPLQDKVHLMFWGLRKDLKDVDAVTFLGSGYINKEDNGAVTESLRRALEAAKMRI